MAVLRCSGKLSKQGNYHFVDNSRSSWFLCRLAPMVQLPLFDEFSSYFKLHNEAMWNTCKNSCTLSSRLGMQIEKLKPLFPQKDVRRGSVHNLTLEKWGRWTRNLKPNAGETRPNRQARRTWRARRRPTASSIGMVKGSNLVKSISLFQQNLKREHYTTNDLWFEHRCDWFNNQ